VVSESIPLPLKDEGRMEFLGGFASPALESTFRERHFRDDRWLSGFLVTAGMLRVSLFLLADYRDFGIGQAFWLLFAGRVLFLLISAWVLVALRRAASPAGADRLFFGWGFLIVAMTVSALSARPPSNNGLLLMSFGMIVVTYCIAPLPLYRQATLALTYSAAALFACRQADGTTLATVGAIHALAHLFGAIMSWRHNHRRRGMFLGVLREAELRTGLETALAKIRTLRGLLCICAWCKRIRDEAQAWESMENYVQSRTDASFTHGMCPDCFQSEVAKIATTSEPVPSRTPSGGWNRSKPAISGMPTP
jgi:hypothetical protein